MTPSRAAGLARIYTIVAALIDTNVLVYRFDARFPAKQKIAAELLRSGIERESLRLPHQAIVEFVAAVTRNLPGYGWLLPPEDARREAEEMISQFTVLYPAEGLVRTALRGAAAYQLSWFDAHLWAYAEHYRLPEIYSEDFEHGRLYGTVRVVNPFL
ncbi:MAG: PIN domain-containing protein [Acidimicrobiia bacterium]|nr:PIN domain-containing protein [Acidimicrobiia bacterium]